MSPTESKSINNLQQTMELVLSEVQQMRSVLSEVQQLRQDVESYRHEVTDYKQEVLAYKQEVGTFNDKFENYQKATQWVVQLAFGLIAAATVTVVVSSVFNK